MFANKPDTVDPVADKPSTQTLPRGRHNLTRAQVRGSQRDRMLRGMAEAVAERGYAHTTVADVLRRVHVSRETFYQHFTDKQDCFLAVVNRSAELLLEAMAVGAEDAATDSPTKRFDRLLRTYLTTLQAESVVAKVVLVESFTAGDPARQRRFELQEQFAAAVAANFADDPAWQRLPDPMFAARMLVGGISAMVTSALAAGRVEDLPTLHGPVMAFVGVVVPERESHGYQESVR
jgi:TetR/AcrR family transcriptional regulator